MNKLILPLLLAGLLSACSTMSPQECKVANWSEVGLRDGLAGESLSHLSERVNDCAEVGVKVNTAQYLQGRQQGLQEYCQLSNATRLGLDGKEYRGVCPAAIDGEFRRRRDLGYELYDTRNQLRNLDTRRNDLERRLRDASKDDERRRLRDELWSLDQRYARLRDRQRDVEWSLDRLR